jgi:hypothetical protein
MAPPTLKEWTSFNIAAACATELSGCDYSAEVLRAIHRHRKREFIPDRKDTHWGKRKLKRDQ